jgi:RecJ-like exonuclease
VQEEAPEECSRCKGEGYTVQVVELVLKSRVECPICEGTGEAHFDGVCTRCDGIGEVKYCHQCDITSVSARFVDEEWNVCPQCGGAVSTHDCKQCGGNYTIDLNKGTDFCIECSGSGIVEVFEERILEPK